MQSSYHMDVSHIKNKCSVSFNARACQKCNTFCFVSILASLLRSNKFRSTSLSLFVNPHCICCVFYVEHSDLVRVQRWTWQRWTSHFHITTFTVMWGPDHSLPQRAVRHQYFMKVPALHTQKIYGGNQDSDEKIFERSLGSDLFGRNLGT